MAGDIQLPRLRPNRPVPRGLEAGLERIAGMVARGRARRAGLDAEAAAILARVEAGLPGGARELDAEIAACMRRWRGARERTADSRCRALAAIAQAARLELGITPYHEQLLGALALERGWLAEMATGEGKTLTLALAAVLVAWTGRPCQVLTANDYLAARDARALAVFYRRCGVTAAHVVGETPPAARAAAYAAGVVYTTSRELMGDFLRDRLRLGERVTPESWRPWLRRHGGAGPETLLRRIHTVFVDEADHVLVDEAVTPLIISAPSDHRYLDHLCEQALAEARPLREGVDFSVDQKRRRARVAAHVSRARAGAGRHPLLSVPRWREEWVGKALAALHVYARDRHYFVREGRIVLIDEATGRPMPDRTLGEGLHALLEAKEGLPVSAPMATLASLSFQRFFRQIPRLAGVTGTARDAAAEFWRLYRLPVLVVRPHRPVRRELRPLRGFPDETAKWDYVVNQVRHWQRSGQPVLIGTRTVAASEALAARLRRAEIAFALLNGVRDENEAAIIAGAGHARQVTIATDMAGRGTDIVPTGVALESGGLRVIATERHRSKRVDRQLYGRAGRQGQPGVVEPLGCWDDEILQHHLPAWWRRFGPRWLGTGRGLRWSLAVAQWRAGRWDAQRRLTVLKHDQWLDENLSLGAASKTPRRAESPAPRA